MQSIVSTVKNNTKYQSSMGIRQVGWRQSVSSRRQHKNLMKIHRIKWSHLSSIAPFRQFLRYCFLYTQISNILGNTLSKVAKVLYWFDDVNISELYEEFQGRKMIIWDSLDQIIPEFASVKMGLFNRKIRQYKQNQIKVKKNELN